MQAITLKHHNNSNVDALRAWLTLILTPGLGPVSLLALLQRFQSPENVLRAARTDLEDLLRPAQLTAFTQHDRTPEIETTLAWLAQAGNSLLTLSDTDYPPHLLNIPTPPVALFVKGNRALLSAPSLAIVGSRHATQSGCDNARAFAEHLSHAGFTIVSGLAAGIDTAAHEGSLSGPGSTIAVVGTGLDRIYPARNKALAHAIAERGVIISEYPLGSPPVAGHFPQRNRLISGLSRGCLVVEAAVESGSLITAKDAMETGREVFAIPGSIHSALAKGCHQLIKQGAKLVETADDILSELAWQMPRPNIAPTPSAATVEPALLARIPFDPTTLDQLLVITGLNVGELMGELLQLELQGAIETLPGGRYQRRH